VPIGAVLPYVFAFFLVLSLLEDSGYLPRLAILSDTVMHHMGLHGMSIVPMLLGLGCAVPGVLSARILESKRERFIAITLMAICVPCMAQIAMIVGLAGRFGPFALVPIFVTLFVVWVVLGTVMKRLVRGESPELIIDVPPYRLPYWKGLLKKVWMRFVWFIRGAVPWVLAGVLIINILHTLGVIGFIGGIVKPVVTGLLDLPPDAVGALIMGFLRKDIAVGLLAPLGLSMKQVIVACVVLTMYFPCVGAFAVMFKELGPKDMLKSAVVMLCSALAVGTVLNLLLGLFM
jgi:ferrous iron transport protein B